MKRKTVAKQFKDVLFQSGNLTDGQLIQQINDLDIKTENEFQGLIVVTLREIITLTKNKKGEKK